MSIDPSARQSSEPTPGVNVDELVDKKYADKTSDELTAAPLDALTGLSPAKAALLTQALGVTIVAELANHKIIRAAATLAEQSPSNRGR